MRRTFGLRLLLPLSLGAAVLSLGALQYRWLGQVSESERQELRHSFERRAQEFAAEADNESGGLYQAFTSLVDGPDAELAAGIGERLAAWQEANRYPTLARALFVIRAQGPHDTALRFNPERGTLDEIPTPPEIAPVFDRLRFGGSGNFRRGEQSFTQVATIGGSSFVGRVPARLVWLWGNDKRLARSANLAVSPGFPGNMVVRAPLTERILLIQLDRTVMAEDMLPAMLANHFGEGPRTSTSPQAPHPNVLPPRLYERGSAVRLQVVDAENTVVVAAGMKPGESFPADRADVTAPFFGTEDTWHLLVQHGAGSLDQAVAHTRRLNLSLSLGTLSALAVAMVLVTGNAQRSKRLAAQQIQFMAAVSHELRTPIAVIRSAADNLTAGIVQSPVQAKHYGELIEAEGRRLTDMIEQVLEQANVHAHRPSPRRVDVDVAALLRDTARAWMPVVSRAGMTLDVAIATDVPHLFADDRALRQMLDNLIGNALRHAGAGGWIGVAARLVPGDARARLVDRAPGTPVRVRPIEWIELTVSDHGPGIERDERGRVFEAFYRGRLALERQTQGSGLGLSLVKHVVDDHGGRIDVGETEGGGATFTVWLPVLPDPATRGASADA